MTRFDVAAIIDRRLTEARDAILADLAAMPSAELTRGLPTSGTALTSPEGLARQMVDDKRAYSVDEFCESVGLSHSTAYDLLATGQLRSFKVGRRRIIPVEAVNEWIDHNLQ